MNQYDVTVMGRTWTLKERTEMSRAYDKGNHAAAYEALFPELILGPDGRFKSKLYDQYQAHEQAAYLLGFFSSFELTEIPEGARDAYEEAYLSQAGQYIVTVAGYCESRDDEFLALRGEE